MTSFRLYYSVLCIEELMQLIKYSHRKLAKYIRAKDQRIEFECEDCETLKMATINR